MNEKWKNFRGAIGFLVAALGVALGYAVICDSRIVEFMTNEYYYYNGYEMCNINPDFYTFIRVCVIICVCVLVMLALHETMKGEDRLTSMKFDIAASQLDIKDAKKEIDRLIAHVSELNTKIENMEKELSKMTKAE